MVGDEGLEPSTRRLRELELERCAAAVLAQINGDDTRAAEARSLLELGWRRRVDDAWTEADREALHKQDRGKREAVWRLRDALGRRHKLYPSIYRFDVLDLTEAEIMKLVEAAETASCANDLDPVADAICRLRLDGQEMDMTTFGAMVLHAEIAPEFERSPRR